VNLTASGGRALRVQRAGQGERTWIHGATGEGAALFHIQDEKVTRLLVYIDRGRAFADLGLSAEDTT
jgi:hypothetical protein